MTESPFKRVTLMGTGLIGGSWGLALKRAGFGGRIIGCDCPAVLEKAIALGAIDEAQPALGSAACEADLVIMAAPVCGILDELPRVREAVPSGCLVTDTGSTKRAIVERARPLFSGDRLFLGGHPLAGKENSGVERADPNLFDNVRYVLCPTDSADLEDERVHAFKALIESLGGRPYVTGAEDHDWALAYLSHLPQLLSTALAAVIADEGRLPLELGAAGFRDMTRLAESPYEVWRDVCLTNADHLKDALEGLIRKLETIKREIDAPSLSSAFDEARRLRERWRKV